MVRQQKMRFKISEIFDSIQGEGLMVGTPMNFIRFCSCNLSCSWCDTEFENGEEMEVEDILKKLNGRWRWVSLTGGEPMLEENLDKLIDELHNNYFKVLLETNATIFNGKIFDKSDFISADIKPPSSGNVGWDSRVMEYCIKNPGRSQLKVVIQNDEDLEFFWGIYREDYPNWILQPEWSVVRKLNYGKILNSIQENVRIIPQVHKVIKVR
ncbi:MAG: 7-carboxy-7-deazaguanine synthase QueE [Candidatus Altiarchaeales archaeon ex4484_43]|nr:MAG: 7-carboxy-7-deazaguanine synthase QueE [Candidatus Altiarchaeales archaeon ex4484_43]